MGGSSIAHIYFTVQLGKQQQQQQQSRVDEEDEEGVILRIADILE